MAITQPPQSPKDVYMPHRTPYAVHVLYIYGLSVAKFSLVSIPLGST